MVWWLFDLRKSHSLPCLLLRRVLFSLYDIFLISQKWFLLISVMQSISKLCLKNMLWSRAENCYIYANPALLSSVTFGCFCIWIAPVLKSNYAPFHISNSWFKQCLDQQVFHEHRTCVQDSALCCCLNNALQRRKVNYQLF